MESVGGHITREIFLMQVEYNFCSPVMCPHPVPILPVMNEGAERFYLKGQLQDRLKVVSTFSLCGRKFCDGFLMTALGLLRAGCMGGAAWGDRRRSVGVP